MQRLMWTETRRLKSSIGVRRSSPENMFKSRALSSGQASSGVIPCKPILLPKWLNAAADTVGVCSKAGNEKIEVLLGGPRIELESKLLGPKKSLRESSRMRLPEPLDMIGVRFVAAAAAAFSSFFFSLSALPPCRRSSPLTDLENPGD